MVVEIVPDDDVRKIEHRKVRLKITPFHGKNSSLLDR